MFLDRECRLPLHDARMIRRIWHGRVRASKAVAYTAFLVKRAIPDYRSVEGNIDVEILRCGRRRRDPLPHGDALGTWKR